MLLDLTILPLLLANGYSTGQTINDPLTLSLPEAVRLAIAQYPEVGKARAGADALKGKIREVRAQALPQVDMNSGFLRWRDPSLLNTSGIDQWPPELRNALTPQPVNLFNYSLSVQQPLYTAGKVGTALRLAQIEAEGAMTDIDRAQQDLALNVTRSFYAVLWAERYLKLVEETQQQKVQHAEMARTRFRNGVATEVDVLRSEVAVANGEPDVTRARNAIKQARAQLNFYLVRPIDAELTVSGDFNDQPWETWDLEELAREAMRRRPELIRLRIAERSATEQIKLAEAESKTRVDMNATYGIIARDASNLFNSGFTRWTLGFTFTRPVFDGFRRSGMVQQAVANQRSTHLEREKTQEQVRLALQQGLDEIAAARETIMAAKVNVGQAEKVLSMMQNNYKWGAATTLDILDAQTAVSVARSNLLRGLHDYAVARANLRWAMGMTPWE
jgi:outer membrane protein TolC